MNPCLKAHAAKVLPYWPPGVERIKISKRGEWMFELVSVEAVVRYENDLAFKRLGIGSKIYKGQSCTEHHYNLARGI